MSRNPRGEFFDGPGWMCLSILFYGWTAASSGTAPWLRIVAALGLAAWVTLLARHLLRRVHARTFSEPPEGPADPPRTG